MISRHVGVDRLVVGDAGAERVGERDVAGAIGVEQPGTPSANRRGTPADRGSRRPRGGRSRPRAAAPRSSACRRCCRGRRGRGPRRARCPSAARGTRARSRPSCRRRASAARSSDRAARRRQRAQRREQRLAVVLDRPDVVRSKSAGKMRFITWRFASMYDTPLGTRRLSSSTTNRPSGRRTRSVPIDLT